MQNYIIKNWHGLLRLTGKFDEFFRLNPKLKIGKKIPIIERPEVDSKKLLQKRMSRRKKNKEDFGKKKKKSKQKLDKRLKFLFLLIAFFW